MPEDTPKLNLTLKTDEALFFAARADAEKLRRDYIDAVNALNKPPHGEETRQALARLDRARAYLSQAMTLMDLARGDGVW